MVNFAAYLFLTSEKVGKRDKVEGIYDEMVLTLCGERDRVDRVYEFRDGLLLLH